ncbi:MAG: uracil-DNA glycosylase [Actinomycetota bacterium]|nr:uracil-DNA glycosylase [Actinomycetota bacterium]
MTSAGHPQGRAEAVLSAPRATRVKRGWESLAALEHDVVRCRRCPRLVAWREKVACEKRAAYADEDYWGRPVPGFGDPQARLLVVGLAPAAHGGNRTGRVFTGDRSGDWLFGALYRAGFANQPTATHRADGLVVGDCWVTAPVKCAPPANRPSVEERDSCDRYFRAEVELLPVEVVVALGSFGWEAALRRFGPVRPKPRFRHGAEVAVGTVTLLGCYHVSQQNTFTGRLTRDMLDAVFARARYLLARQPDASKPVGS